MRRRGWGLLAILAALAAGGGRAEAQQGGTVRGVVRAADGAPVPYAVVALLPGDSAQFTDDSGAFLFPGVVPGTYHLVTRQVGYRPADTTVVVQRGARLTVQVVLEQLAVELAAIKVEARGRGCVYPGPPDSAVQPQLAEVFDQLRENAARSRLLARTYPFYFRMARTFVDYDAAGSAVDSTRDTLLLSSALRSYRPGRVVTMGRGVGSELSLVVNLPMLADFADSTFQASHCFAYAGLVSHGRGLVVRFRFVPAQSIRTPDIEGEVDLDPDNYQVRRAVISLTRPGRAMQGLASDSSVITFTEVFPNVLMPGRIDGVLRPFFQGGVSHQIARYTEVQRLVGVEFARPLPGAPTPRLPDQGPGG